MMKICRVCNIEKDNDLFVRHRTDKICKECNKQYRKSKHKYKTRPWSSNIGFKICRECNVKKPLDYFHKHKGGMGGVDSICKPCNIKKVNAPERMEYIINWNKNNRERVNKNASKRDKILVKTNIEYRIKKHLTIRMWEVIVKRAKSTRDGKIENLIGCSVQEYRNNIEKQWEPNMNWDNHGVVWEIDHIKPLSSFNLTKYEEQCKAFHYTNTQPLTISENRKKKDKLNYKIK